MPGPYSKLIKVESNYFKAPWLTCRWVKTTVLKTKLNYSSTLGMFHLGDHNTKLSVAMIAINSRRSMELLDQHDYSGDTARAGGPCANSISVSWRLDQTCKLSGPSPDLQNQKLPVGPRNLYLMIPPCLKG